LKLAESHFRRQDFASAQTEFETRPRGTPKPARPDQASFLPPQSALAGRAGKRRAQPWDWLRKALAWTGKFRWLRGMDRKESDRDGALASFYRILEFNPSPDRPPEFFWFYKAGFNAARLLEEQQKWEAAAAIYEKLVAANGPRSEEANARLGQLRLEHFLW